MPKISKKVIYAATKDRQRSLGSIGGPGKPTPENTRIGGSSEMTEKKVSKGRFKHDKDSAKYHRYQLKAEGGIVGTLYVPKDAKDIPDSIVLKKIAN